MTKGGLDFRFSVLNFYVDQVDRELDALVAGVVTHVSIHPEDLLVLLRGRLSRCESDSSYRLLRLMGALQRLSIRCLPRNLTEVELRTRYDELTMANALAFAIWAEAAGSLYDDFELLRVDPLREIPDE